MLYLAMAAGLAALWAGQAVVLCGMEIHYLLHHETYMLLHSLGLLLGFSVRPSLVSLFHQP